MVKSGGSKDFTSVKSFPFCVVRKKKNIFFFFAHFLERANPSGSPPRQNNQNQNKTPTESSSDSGDLGGSRTRVVGMKTRCTNRYTTRPDC